jgi:glycosyltransferase involved in cell wall biosynthesis
MNKKVLIVTPVLDFSGAPLALLSLCRELVAKGYVVDLYSRPGGVLRDAFLVLGISIVNTINKKYDLIIANTVLMVEAMPMLRKFSNKIFWWIHEDINFWSALSITQEKFLKCTPNLVMVPNEYMIKQYQEFMPDTKFYVLSPSVENPYWMPPSDGKFCVVGSIEPRKNQKWLVDIWSKFNLRYQVKYIGADDNFFKINNSLMFNLGKLEPLDSKREIAKSIGLISASIAETLNISAIESIMAGRPCLLSNIEAHHELAKKFDSVFLFDFRDPIGFIVGLGRLIEATKNIDSALRNKMFAHDHYSVQIIQRKISEIIDF